MQAEKAWFCATQAGEIDTQNKGKIVVSDVNVRALGGQRPMKRAAILSSSPISFNERTEHQIFLCLIWLTAESLTSAG